MLSHRASPADRNPVAAHAHFGILVAMSVDRDAADRLVTTDTDHDPPAQASNANKKAVQAAGDASVQRIGGSGGTESKPPGGFHKVLNFLDTIFGEDGTPTWHNKPVKEAKKSGGKSDDKGGKGGGGKGGGGKGGGGKGGGGKGGGGGKDDADKTDADKTDADKTDADKKTDDVPGVKFTSGDWSGSAGGSSDAGGKGELKYDGDEIKGDLKGTVSGSKSTLEGTVEHDFNDDVKLKGIGDAIGTKQGGGVELDVGGKGPVTSKTKLEETTKSGLEATETIGAKKGGVTTSVMGGLKSDHLETNADLKYKAKSGFGAGVTEKSDSKQGLSVGGDVEYDRSKFGIGANATVDGKKGPTIGGHLHVGKKDGDGFDVSVSSGTKGISASATVKIHQVKVGVVFKNGAILTVTLDLGPKHPDLNQALRIALGMASAAVNPIPFALGAAFRLARKLFHKKKKPAPTPTPTPTTPDKSSAGAGAPANNEIVAVLTSDDVDAMTQNGLIHPSGYLNLGLSHDAFLDGLAGAQLDETQRAALATTYVESDTWLPPAESAGETELASVAAASSDDPSSSA